ncbi:MFS transporter [Nocardia sp. NEAU-G5]|uniref:MFS transporter n=1 Tax=Nocardia albiluteola TaxID=2842303 RepID=A0ABS6AYT5_9NOCA|nr:MFS transporter [Nocardia albiluteola]
MTSWGAGTGGGHRRVWGVPIFVLGGLQLLVVLDGTVVALALPKIRDALGLTESAGNWIITAYVLAFGGLMLLGGRLGDSFGRKRVFATGVTVFTLTSLLCGLAWDQTSLIVGRTLQGMSAAAAAPTAMALIATTYAPGKPRSQAFAIYAALSGVGSVAGLVAGGVLTELSWRLVFLINVPIGMLVAVGAVVCLRESDGPRSGLDVPGAMLATFGVTAAVFAVNEGPSGWGRPIVIIPAVAAAVLLVAFVIVEQRAANPILPFTVFANPSRVAALGAIVLAGAIVMCLAVFISLYLQGILRYSPLESGLAVAPFAAGLGVAAAIASKLALHWQPRWLVILGGTIILIGCLYASAVATEQPAYFPAIAAAVTMVGFGVGLAVIPLTLSVIAGATTSEIGPLTALAQVAQNLGGAAGLVIVGAVASSRALSMGGPTTAIPNMSEPQTHALASGYGLAFTCCAAIAVAAGVIVLMMRFTPQDVAEGQAAQDAVRRTRRGDCRRRCVSAASDAARADRRKPLQRPRDSRTLLGLGRIILPRSRIHPRAGGLVRGRRRGHDPHAGARARGREGGGAVCADRRLPAGHRHADALAGEHRQCGHGESGSRGRADVRHPAGGCGAVREIPADGSRGVDRQLGPVPVVSLGAAGGGAGPGDAHRGRRANARDDHLLRESGAVDAAARAPRRGTGFAGFLCGRGHVRHRNLPARGYHPAAGVPARARGPQHPVPGVQRAQQPAVRRKGFRSSGLTDWRTGRSWPG